jgi:dehydrogenase/reductase SDR family member 12
VSAAPTGRFQRSINLPQAPAEVFALVGDYSNAPRWDRHTARAEKLTPGPVRVGTRFVLHARMLGLEMKLPYEVRELEPGRRIVLSGTSRFFTYRDEIRVAPHPGGSRLSWDAELGLRGPLGLLSGGLTGPALSFVLGTVGGEALEGIRRILGPASGPPSGT